jgi:hypothetical protein
MNHHVYNNTLITQIYILLICTSVQAMHVCNQKIMNKQIPLQDQWELLQDLLESSPRLKVMN